VGVLRKPPGKTSRWFGRPAVGGREQGRLAGRWTRGSQSAWLKALRAGSTLEFRMPYGRMLTGTWRMEQGRRIPPRRYIMLAVSHRAPRGAGATSGPRARRGTLGATLSLSHGRIIFAASSTTIYAQLGVDASERPEHGGETTARRCARSQVSCARGRCRWRRLARGLRSGEAHDRVAAVARARERRIVVGGLIESSAEPAQMAISLVDESRRTVEVHELEQRSLRSCDGARLL